MNKVQLTEKMNEANVRLQQLSLDGTALEDELSGKLLLESLGTKQTGLDKLEKDVRRNDAMQLALSEHIIELQEEFDSLDYVDTEQSKQDAIKAVAARKNNAIVLENIMIEPLIKQVASYMALLDERLHNPDLSISIKKICTEPMFQAFYDEAWSAQKAKLHALKPSEPAELIVKPSINGYDELRKERELKEKDDTPKIGHDYSKEPIYNSEEERVEAMFKGNNKSVRVKRA